MVGEKGLFPKNLQMDGWGRIDPLVMIAECFADVSLTLWTKDLYTEGRNDLSWVC